MRKFISFLSLVFMLNTAIAQEKPQIVPGNIIVQVPNKNINEVINSNQTFEGQPTDLKLNRLLSAPMAAYLLEFDPSINHNKLLQQLWNHPSVTLIQLNHYIQYRGVTPNDPQLNQQWWHINTGGGGAIADADIDSDQAWEITTGGVTATGDTIVVCVIDDGGDLNHPDLMANNWVNHHEIPNNGIDDDGNGYIDDYFGWNTVDDSDDIDNGDHGVNVAGMIGAVGNNSVGVVGVNWNVKIMNMTHGSIGSGSSPNEANVIEAYTYPLIMRRLYEQTNGAKGAYVVATNSSWGINNANPLNAPLWCAFYDTLGLSGILSAASTSNSNVNVDVVGDLPTGCSSQYMLSVTATNYADVRTFSGYGQTTIDLAAPGEDVRTTAAGGGYATETGTSFASPATAGAIALMYSAPCPSLAAISHSDPALAAQMVRDAIFNGVDPIANLTTECVTGGRLNLKGALDQILNTCIVGGCFPPFSLGTNNVTDTEADLVWNHLAAIDTFNINYGAVGDTASTANNLETNSFALSGLSACTNYWFIAQSMCDGEASIWSDTLFFKTDGCCEAPLQITLSNPNETEATATWSSVLAADSYLLQWRPVSGGSWIQENNITATTFNISDLAGCTEYEVQVATNCNGGTTNFTPSSVVTTFGCGSCTDETFCASSGGNYLEWIGNVTVDVLNHTSDSEPDGYGDYTDLSVDLKRNQPYNVSLSPAYLTFPYNEYFRIWIDFDQNGTFNNNELVFSSTQGTTSAATGTITVPLSAELGSARMRVTVTDGTGFPNGPCGNLFYGEVEDYCVNILEEDSVNDGITELSGTFGMEAFPIPATDVLTVKIVDQNVAVINIILMDAAGRVISSTPSNGQNTQRVAIAHLAQGVYMLELHNKQAQVVGRTRFVKQ